MPVKNAENRKQKHKKSEKSARCCGDCCFFRKKPKDVESKDLNSELNSMVNKIKAKAVVREPFCLELPQDLSCGHCINIEIQILPECTRFSINLTTSQDPRADIALHLNPRLAQRYIVRNSRIDGHWGKEETTSITKFLLERNTKFNVNIFISDKDFLVSINGRHVCGYVFRIPIEKVRRLIVEGAVEVTGAHLSKVGVYPSPSSFNESYMVPTGDGSDRPKVQPLEVPLTADLPKGFQQGWQLEIHGHVKVLPDTFFINLQEGKQLWPHPVIPLHLNPRFSGAHGNHIFVRNSWSDGCWGQEERTTGFQFIPGTNFDVAIRKHDSYFSVWVDGKLVGEFKFRTTVDNIDTVYIQGDIMLSSIYMKDHIDDTYFTKKKKDGAVSL